MSRSTISTKPGARMQEQPSPPDLDPAHGAGSEDAPNPGDPGPDVPEPRPRVDPANDPRIPIDAPPSRGV